jgi:hypothetical protein
MIYCEDCKIKTPKGRVGWQRKINKVLLNHTTNLNDAADIYGAIIYIINKELQKYVRRKNRRSRRRS